jgi:hypothetical protein
VKIWVVGWSAQLNCDNQEQIHSRKKTDFHEKTGSFAHLPTLRLCAGLIFFRQDYAQINPQRLNVQLPSVLPQTDMSGTNCLRLSTGETETFTVSTSAPTPLKHSSSQVSTLGAWFVPPALNVKSTRSPMKVILLYQVQR